MSGLLNKIDTPHDLRKLEPGQLETLCSELRSFVLQTTKTKEGHIKASLGVTELSVALHYFFNTPNDILVWDVGHQAYLHKVLTGRKNQFHTNRQRGGISGFTLTGESVYDPFGAGHSSTSISAVAGFCKADQLNNNPRQRIAVIGDGALTGGMAFEALNYLGQEQANCWVILNDNGRSIDENVGALQHYASYQQLAAALGFTFRQCQGHSTQVLLAQFKELAAFKGPKLLRVITQKGRGYLPQNVAAQATQPTFQQAFGNSVLQLLQQDENLVVISPAMLSGANLTAAKNQFPHRVIDVGIAEQHAVTMAAALAAAGKKVICHLYSTFAQRAADQIIHDVALQKLPVLFALDRAGLVGQDGATHHGVFDVSLFSGIPNLTMAAPLSGDDLDWQLRQFMAKPQATLLRYPKDAYQTYWQLSAGFSPRWLKKGHEKCLVSYGAIASEAQAAVENTDYAHLNLPQLQPFPAVELEQLLKPFSQILSVEENAAAGGLGEKLASLMAAGKLNGQLKKTHLPHRFIVHGKRQELLEECGLDAASLKKHLAANWW